ncbi:hypothetical protein [Edwardsiella tarda]|uniref:Uncharacterized protein n=1 Tax=Edwardsiella tarda ATCC 15947 = NBRC 105688 TaxID=667121 RepID=A0AC61TN47_EDWTA|nr:hypothetical protein [Edwardsiella tarda]UAL58103.1 hypothetical protein K8O98_17220 [Edwardsiella tarda]UCQ02037.1 hypothetical protein DCL27_17175 [Edwardsiella tarda ATCC 15947 = NBRC 105688]
MLDVINDGVDFFRAITFSMLIWTAFCIAAWYIFFKAQHYSWRGRNLIDFIDLFPTWFVNGVLAAWFITGTFPLLDYIADKEQFSHTLGQIGEIVFLDERPWYGVGSYQLMVVLLIVIVSHLIHRYNKG